MPCGPNGPNGLDLLAVRASYEEAKGRSQSGITILAPGWSLLRLYAFAFAEFSTEGARLSPGLTKSQAIAPSPAMTAAT